MGVIEAEESLMANVTVKEMTAAEVGGGKKAKMLPIEKLRATNKLNTMLATATSKSQSLDDLHEKTKSKLGRMKSSSDDGQVADDNGSTIAEIAGKIVDTYKLANAHFGVIKEYILKSVQELNFADDVDHVQAHLTQCGEKMKELKRGAAKDYRLVVAQFNHVTKIQGQKIGRKRAAEREAESQASAVKPALWTVVSKCEQSLNLAQSVFEVKGGLRACTGVVKSQEKFDAIISSPLVRKAAKKNFAALKTENKPCVSTFLDAGAQATKRFNELIRRSVDPELCSTAALPKAEWSKKVFGYEVQCTNDSYVYAGWTHLGQMETVLVLHGDLSVIGIATASLPGSSFKEKRSNIMQMPAQEIYRLAASSGFAAKFENGSTTEGHCYVAIPSGFFILLAANKAQYLRWSFSGDDRDRMRVKQTLGELLTSFPELRAAAVGYSELSTWLAS